MKWRAVIGFEGLYEISDRGDLRRIGKDSLGRNRYMGRTLARSFSRGYVHYVIRKPGEKGKNVLAHVLVAEAFIGPRPYGKQINHKNGDKSDSRLKNLEYVTRSENHRHALKNGLFVPPRGEKHWAAKLTDDQIRQIYNRANAGEEYQSLAQEFGCSRATISRFRNGIGRAAICLS